MKIDLNGKNIEVTIVQNPQNKYEYEYYIGNVQIGELNTNIVKYGNVIMRENSYILEALQKLGVMEQDKAEKQNTLKNELSAQIKDKIDALDREDIENEAKETREISKYIDELRIERSHIRDVRILGLNRDDNKSNDNKKQNENKRNLESKMTEQQQVNNKKAQQQENNNSTTKNTNILQEIELDERANDMHDIRKWLGGKIPKYITKVGVIYSEQMNKMKDENGKSYDRNSTRYSLVAISKDGKVEPLQKYIPELQQRSASGDNPVPRKYQVRDDGTVEKDSILSEYEIGDKVIQLDNKDMGRIEMNIGEEARDSTETMGVQVRDSNTIFATDTSTRAVIGEYEREGEDSVEENLEEIKAHDKEHKDCNKTTEKDIDGDSSTKSEHVMAMEEAYIKVCAREILDKNPELGETYNQNDIENKLKEKVKNKEYLSKEEIENSLDDIAKDLENEAEIVRLPGEDRRA